MKGDSGLMNPDDVGEEVMLETKEGISVRVRSRRSRMCEDVSSCSRSVPCYLGSCRRYKNND